jgi:UDP-N-acetylglucosamine 2-epimerase
MPEEHNRVLTDHCSDVLFCPTQTAVNNLGSEGIRAGVHLVGDTMYDAVQQFSQIALQKSMILDTLGLKPRDYLLATIHRAYNTDCPTMLLSIMSAFKLIDETILFPIHPRTLQALTALDIAIPPNVHTIDPVGYLDMLVLEQNACAILTDSGGIQAFQGSMPHLTAGIPLLGLMQLILFLLEFIHFIKFSTPDYLVMAKLAKNC